MSNPGIILVSGDRLDVLGQQLVRDAGEYDVRVAEGGLAPGEVLSTSRTAG